MASYPTDLDYTLQDAQSVLRCVAVPRALDEVDAALEDAWTVYDFVPMHIRTQLRIAVAELVANIFEHGSAGRHLVRLEMRMSVASERVAMVLIDDGNESHADLATVCMPDFTSERGRGLAMAKAVLDELGYRREADENHWLLISRRF